MAGMKRDYAISLLIHLAVFAVVVIASASVGKASRPDLNLGPSVSVRMGENIPKGTPDMPALQTPALAAVEDSYVPEPVKLQSITQKEEFKKAKPEPEKKPEKKPQKIKQEVKQSNDLATVETKDQPSGSSMEMSVGGDEAGVEGVYNGPLGEYYLAYDFNYLRSRIRQNWNNPYRSNVEISCKIYFQVTKDGNIKGVVVSESSGIQIFDKYAKMAVEATKKLPSLPQSFPDNEVLEVNMRFVHRP